jgi:hypothetical protein
MMLVKHRRRASLVLALLACCAGMSHAASRDHQQLFRATNLQVNRIVAAPAVPSASLPIVDHGRQVHFSWHIACSAPNKLMCRRGPRATAYRLRLSDNLTGKTLWDSGTQMSGRTWHTLSANERQMLPSDARFRWSVSVLTRPKQDTTKAATDGVWATTHAQFQTALRAASDPGDPTGDWGGAQWIGNFTQARRVFSVRSDSAVVMATAYASGLGCFALTLNGQPVDTSMMDPGWSTIPPIRLLYRAYNVSAMLHPGEENGLGVRLGFCHYGYIDQAFCISGHAMRSTCRGFLLRLSIRYADGQRQDVLTTAANATAAASRQWLGTVEKNAMVYTHLYHGEVFDNRMVQRGWDLANFSAHSQSDGWHAVERYTPSTAYEGPTQPGLQMSLHEMPAMGVQERRPPINITKLQLQAPFGDFILPSGRMVPVKGGYLRGMHRWPVLSATSSTSCQRACLNAPNGDCAQAIWDASVPAAGTMERVFNGGFPAGAVGGYYNRASLGIRPEPNVSTEAACSTSCLAEKLCVQTTWTPPRANERCDLYLGSTDPSPAAFSNGTNGSASIHGWVKIARCTLFSTVYAAELVNSTTTQAWQRETGGVCPAGPSAGNITYPSGCAWFVDRRTHTKHFVRNCAQPLPGFQCPEAASRCWKQTQGLLSKQLLMPDEQVAAIPVGKNFTCQMLGDTGDKCRVSPIDRNLTVHLYDFGQNFAGAAHTRPRLHLLGLDCDLTSRVSCARLVGGRIAAGVTELRLRNLPRGTRVLVRHSEFLSDPLSNPSGCSDVMPQQCPVAKASPDSQFDGGWPCAPRSLGDRDLDRDQGGNQANQTVLFISSGAAEEVFRPSFSYMGFRYASITGLPAAYVPTAETLTALRVNTRVRTVGHVQFNASVNVLNKIQKAVQYTLLSNIHSHPEDCPQVCAAAYHQCFQHYLCIVYYYSTVYIPLWYMILHFIVV